MVTPNVYDIILANYPMFHRLGSMSSSLSCSIIGKNVYQANKVNLCFGICKQQNVTWQPTLFVIFQYTPHMPLALLCLQILNLPGELAIANTSAVMSITGYLPSARAISTSFSPLTSAGQHC